MSVNKWNNLIGAFAVIGLIAFFYTKGTYYPFYIFSMLCFVLYFLIRKELFVLIVLLSLGAVPVFIEYIYGDFGKKIFVILGAIFVILFLIKKHREGHNIWY
jgi:hypothetical protein